MRVRIPARRRKALTAMVFRIDAGVTVKSSPRTRMRVLPSNHSSHGYLLTDFRTVSVHTLSLTISAIRVIVHNLLYIMSSPAYRFAVPVGPGEHLLAHSRHLRTGQRELVGELVGAVRVPGRRRGPQRHQRRSFGVSRGGRRNRAATSRQLRGVLPLADQPHRHLVRGDERGGWPHADTGADPRP